MAEVQTPDYIGLVLEHPLQGLWDCTYIGRGDLPGKLSLGDHSRVAKQKQNVVP